jgi:glutaredoxin
MFFIYGASNSKACEKAELLLHATRANYRFYVYGRDYNLSQLQRLVPGATTVPQIFYGTQYIGGIKELYDYIYTSENTDFKPTIGPNEVKKFLNFFSKNKSNTPTDSH